MRHTYTYTDFLIYLMHVIKNGINTRMKINELKLLRNRLLKKIDILRNLSRFNAV